MTRPAPLYTVLSYTLYLLSYKTCSTPYLRSVCSFNWLAPAFQSKAGQLAHLWLVAAASSGGYGIKGRPFPRMHRHHQRDANQDCQPRAACRVEEWAVGGRGGGRAVWAKAAGGSSLSNAAC